MRFFNLLNILSIDVSIGSMVCAAFFAAILDVHVRTAGLLSLGLTVWIIYTIDHLLDARKITSQASSDRHRFHQENFAAIRWLLIVALAVDGVLVFFIRRPVLISGMILFTGVAVYLLFQRRIRYVKEAIIAILYTCGIVLPALSLNRNPISPNILVLIFQFGLTAYINLLLFSRFELEEDLRDRQHSIFTEGGERVSAVVVNAALLTQLVLIVAMLVPPLFLPYEWVILVMNLVLAGIHFFPSAFGREGRYRLIGDGVFLMPVIHLAVN